MQSVNLSKTFSTEMSIILSNLINESLLLFSWVSVKLAIFTCYVKPFRPESVWRLLAISLFIIYRTIQISQIFLVPKFLRNFAISSRFSSSLAPSGWQYPLYVFNIWRNHNNVFLLRFLVLFVPYLSTSVSVAWD